MSKCGRNTSSMMPISFSLSRFNSSRWPSIAVASWSAMLCTICTGVCSFAAGAAAAVSWANAGAATTAAKARAVANASLRNMEYSLDMAGGNSRRRGFNSGMALLLAVAGVLLVAGRTVDQELADQILQLHRGLGQDHLVAVLEHVGRAARLDRNILAADQTAGEHRGGGIVGNLVVALVDRQDDLGVELGRVGAHRLHAADHHAGHLHRRARRQGTHVGEIGLDRVAAADVVDHAAGAEELAQHLLQRLRRLGPRQRAAGG